MIAYFTKKSDPGNGRFVVSVPKLKNTVAFLFLLISPLSFGDPALAWTTLEDYLSAHSDYFEMLIPARSNLQLDYMARREHQEQDADGDFDLDWGIFRAEFPIPLTRDDFFRVGVQSGIRRYQISQAGDLPFTDTTTDLYTLAGLLGWGSFITDDILVTGIATSGAFSDFNGGLGNNDLHTSGYAVAIFRTSPRVYFLAGVAATEDFEHIEVFPVLGGRYQSPSGAWHFKVNLPVELKVTWRLTEGVDAYAGGWVSGEEYGANLEGQDVDLQFLDRRVGMGFLFWLSDTLHLSFEGGASIGGEIGFEFRAEDTVTADLENTGYFRSSIGLAF